MSRPQVLVLGGGPDHERVVSLASARAVADALAHSAACSVVHHEIDRIDPEDIARLVDAHHADVIFPALHGPEGEGGPLQDILEHLGRPYVGSRPHAARLAMDKLATKLAAAALGLPTAPAAAVRPGDYAPPIPAPAVIKPVHEGSSVGLHVCRTDDQLADALRALDHAPNGRPRLWMIERLLAGRELTVGLITDGPRGLAPLPPIEIRPASGVYDYDAKYHARDTVYALDPTLPPGLRATLGERAVALCQALGVRHLARVDFIYDESLREAFVLEVNTMPGFTPSSLLPKAASAMMTMTALCERLVLAALDDHRPISTNP